MSKKGPDLNNRRVKGLKVVPAFPADGANDDADDDGGAAGGKRGGSQADKILACCSDLRMVRSTSGDVYAVIAPPHAIALRSREFRMWLTKRAHDVLQTVPKPGNIEAATAVLEGQAFGLPQVPVFVRVGEADGCLFLDLHHAVIRITPTGWDIDPDPPVTFWKPSTAKPLPMPTRGGDICELRRFVRADDDTWPLVVMWLVAASNPMTKGGGFPVLHIVGAEGTAKTTASKAIRMLIDASSEPIASPPTERRDFVAFAKNDYVMNLDNISSVSAEMMDDLCKVVTGVGFQQRAMYTNFEIVTASVKRPVILNGIVDFTSRPDLLSRILRVELQPLGEGERRSDVDVWREYEKHHPAMLGALLDAVVASLTPAPVASNRRLADAECAAVAAEKALGLAPGSILAALDRLDDERHSIALDNWAVWPVLLAMMRSRDRGGKWEGTATELLELLSSQASQTAKQNPQWPKQPNTLSRELNRQAQSMRSSGITYVRVDRAAKQRLLTITYVDPEDGNAGKSPADKRGEDDVP